MAFLVIAARMLHIHCKGLTEDGKNKFFSKAVLFGNKTMFLTLSIVYFVSVLVRWSVAEIPTMINSNLIMMAYFF